MPKTVQEVNWFEQLHPEANKTYDEYVEQVVEEFIVPLIEIEEIKEEEAKEIAEEVSREETLYIELVENLSEELTLNEIIVISNVVITLFLFCIKQKACPTACDPHSAANKARNKLKGKDSSDADKTKIETEPASEDDDDDGDEGDEKKDDKAQEAVPKMKSIYREFEPLETLWPVKKIKFGDSLHKNRLRPNSGLQRNNRDNVLN